MSRSPRLALAGLVATALVMAACGSSTSSPSGGVAGATSSPPASVSAPVSAPESGPAASPSGLNQKFITFQAVNGSNITGGGILTDLGNNQTAVTVGVVAAGVTDPMPAALLPGDCTSAMSAPAPSPAASAAASPAASPAGSPAASASAEASASPIPLNPGDTIKLGDLSAGSSNTVINIGLDGLTSQPYALVIYKSAKDMSVVACADVK